MSPVDAKQPGLRLRLAHEARRLAGQHGYLDALVGATRRAIERDAGAEAGEALIGFRGALESHFALEERLHFPALQGLRPELASDLAELTREHARLRASLDRLKRCSDRVEMTADLDSFSASLRIHEDREERLFDGAGSMR